MLKITTTHSHAEREMVLEGRLVELWVGELKRSWDDAREALQGGRLVIDLKSVTVMSQQSENILFQIMSEEAHSC